MSEPQAIETQLDYASAGIALPAEFVPIARRLLILSILSGLCVGVCFLSPALGSGGMLLHLVIFATTIAVAVSCGRKLFALERRGFFSFRSVMDCTALLGLCLFAVAPLLTDNWEHETTMAWLAVVIFALLASTSTRHIGLYRLLATTCRAAGARRMARSMTVLGWAKAIYESIWLGCCLLMSVGLLDQKLTHQNGNLESTMLFFAFGALFGCMGFGLIWIWMILAHALLLNWARKVARTVGDIPEAAIATVMEAQPL